MHKFILNSDQTYSLMSQALPIFFFLIMQHNQFLNVTREIMISNVVWIVFLRVCTCWFGKLLYFNR